MISTKKLTGKMLHSETPRWQPLINLVGNQVEHFMWMFEVELEDGRHLHAYKHWWTRRYIHLTPEGCAFVYLHREGDRDDPGLYRQVDVYSQLQRVLPSGKQLEDYESFLEEVGERARQDSNLWPRPPEGRALSS